MLGIANTADLAGWQGGTSSSGGQAVLSTVINYPVPINIGYRNSLSYVGPDSYGRPVFFFGYGNATGILNAQMFRIEDNGTITQGAEQATSIQFNDSVACMSEYEGAGSFNTGSPSNYVYYAVNDSVSPTFLWNGLANVNRDALTCSFEGLNAASGISPFTGQPQAAYLGTDGGTAYSMVGARTQSPTNTVRRFSRSGNVLTVVGSTASDQGVSNYYGQLGFLNDGGNQFRSAYFNQSGANTRYGATALGTTDYLANVTISGSSDNGSIGCALNNTDKMLGTYQDSSNTLRAIAIPITWNASSAPTFSAGTAVTVGNITATNASWCPVSGASTDTASIMYNDTTTTISYIPVTTSGNTVTLGSSVQIITGISNIGGQILGSSAKIGSKTYLAGIQSRTSATPYIFGYRLT